MLDDECRGRTRSYGRVDEEEGMWWKQAKQSERMISETRRELYAERVVMRREESKKRLKRAPLEQA